MFYFNIYIYGSGISETFYGHDLEARLRALVMAEKHSGSSVTVEKDDVKVAYYLLHNGEFTCTIASNSATEKVFLGNF